MDFREWLINEAVKTARFFYKVSSLDIEYLSEMIENQKRMKEGKELIQWWLRR